MDNSHVLSIRKLNILFALFVAFFIAMNLLGGKITTLFGVSVSVAIFMMPLTFLITDMVAEVYGPRVTREFVLGAIAAIVVVLLFTALFVKLPAHERYSFNEEYVTIFSNSLRMMLASLIAFAVAQIHDIWAFEYWKKVTKGKYLWLRNNASTAVSQAIDTLLFMFIAFYGISDQFTVLFILELAVVLYAFKLLFAFLDTPLVYLGVRWLKRE